MKIGRLGIVTRRGQLRHISSLVIVGLALVVGLAGCASTPASPGASPSGGASDLTTPSTSLTPTPGPIKTPTSNPSPTAAPPLAFGATGSMHTARTGATATLLSNGKVLMAGGAKTTTGSTEDVYASAELYDPATGKFSPTGSMTAARSFATGTLLPDGRVLIAGGEGCADPRHCSDVIHGINGLEFLASADLYDPATGKFTATGSMTGVAYGGTAILLPDGSVLIAGGNQWADLYDPSSCKFVRTAKQAGFQAAATLLPNGKILLAGDHLGDYRVGGLYDVTSGKFATISLALPAGTPSVQYKGAPITRTVPSTATLLKDGRVLLFEGGYLETYDPESGSCADAGFISPAGEWDDATATLMADGRVLYEGGVLVDPNSDEHASTNTVVLYDPTDGPGRAGSTQVARHYQTATLLPDGSVLIAGGDDSHGQIYSSAELFKP